MRNLGTVGVPRTQALAMATTIPGDLIGRDVRLVPGARADLVHLDDAGALTAVWQGGARVL